MQIRNDYPSYQNHSYETSHTHNITDCLHDEQTKKWEGDMGSSKSESTSAIRQQQRRDALEFSTLIQPENKAAEDKKNGFSVIKGFWDRLGDENGDSVSDIPMLVKENVLSHIQGVFHSARNAIGTVFGQKLLHRLSELPTVVKTGISTALKKFGKGKEAFTTLSDEKMPSRQKDGHAGKQQRGQLTSFQKEEEIPMAELSNHHLMDSYSRTGAYCQINENLTYQKPKASGSDKQVKVQPEE